MLVIALIALVQLAVLVMILAVVTTPSGSTRTNTVERSREQIGQLEHLTVEAMMAEAERAQDENDRYPWD